MLHKSILLQRDNSMFSFFFKNPILIILIVCVVAYFYINPGGKFGFVQKNLVIYNRIPVSFVDLYILPDGSSKPVEDLSKKETLDDIWFNLFQTPSEEKILVIVGTGFSRPSFVLSDEKVVLWEAKGAMIQQLPSREAIKLYNSSVDQHKKVALLLSLRH
jgi:hypothetical protein